MPLTPRSPACGVWFPEADAQDRLAIHPCGNGGRRPVHLRKWGRLRPVSDLAGCDKKDSSPWSPPPQWENTLVLVSNAVKLRSALCSALLSQNGAPDLCFFSDP